MTDYEAFIGTICTIKTDYGAVIGRIRKLSDTQVVVELLTNAALVKQINASERLSLTIEAEDANFFFSANFDRLAIFEEDVLVFAVPTSSIHKNVKRKFRRMNPYVTLGYEMKAFVRPFQPTEKQLNWTKVKVIDLSAGGIKLENKIPLAKHSILQIELKEGGRPPFYLIGDIVHQDEKELSIKFINISSAEQEMLNEFVENSFAGYRIPTE